MEPEDLVEWRRRNKYSQAKLAKVLGVDVMTVSRWERGFRDRKGIPPFLHYALQWLELKGGEQKEGDKRKENEKECGKRGKSKRYL